MIAEIKNVQAEEASLEILILLKKQAEVLMEGYSELNLETPDWILEKAEEVSLELSARTKALIQKELRLEKIRRAGYSTREEKRTASDARIAELEKKLGD